MPKKIDLRKELKDLYTASAKTPGLIRVPRVKYLMVDGAGDPNSSPPFQHAMEALFGVAYTLKFTLKLGPKKLDWGMMPPEGIWWAKGGQSMETASKKDWCWTLMIAQPKFITGAMVREAKNKLKEKRNPACVDDVRLEALSEGACVQILHIGPYAEEGRSIDKLISFAATKGYALAGKHHEIYFSDPRRTKPEKLRTIVRYPVKKGR